MSDKEKVTAGVLAAAIGLFVVAGLGWFFVWEPYSEASGLLEAAKEEKAKKQRDLEAEEATINNVLAVNPRLTVWQDISLPPRDPSLTKATNLSEEDKKRLHVNKVQVQYEQYLSKILTDNGFKASAVVVSPKALPKTATAKGKDQAPFEKLAFTVQAKGDTAAAVKALREFHMTPLLHQVRNVTLALPQRQAGTKAVAADQLDVTMTVEALMVPGAKDRATLMPPSTVKPRVLAEGRDYLAMAKVNMFTGYDPPRERPVEKPREDKKPVERAKQTEDRRFVLGFIKVTTITWNLDRGRWEAYLYDQSKGPRRVIDEEDGERKLSILWEKKLNERILNELKIYDRYNNTTLDAKVAFLGEKVLILKDVTDNKYYKLGIGDNLYEGTNKAMTEGEALQYGLKTEPVKKKVEEEDE